MEQVELYKVNKLNEYYKDYNTNKDELTRNKHSYFRFLCYLYIDFIQQINLPIIPLKSDLEAVLIEYRILPHVEFLIRNTLIKLGEKWSHTVICGSDNYQYMCEMCNRISPNIKVILTNYSNLLADDYNTFLTSTDFWNLLNGEKIFIYQEDSIVFKNNIDDFLHWDYIGAPFPKTQNDTPNCVGNGGISLRTRHIMIEVIQTIKLEETIFHDSTIQYMKNNKLSFPPEDVYFSKNMQDFGIGKVADWDTASLFSTESIVNYNSFCGHKFWIFDTSWKNRMKEHFSYKEYCPNNNILDYLNHIGLTKEHDKNNFISNAFDVDLYFCNYVNKIVNCYNDKNKDHQKRLMSFIQTQALKGFIYHPKQIKNIFPSIHIYEFFNQILIEYNLEIYDAAHFVNKFLYNTTYDDLSKKVIHNKYHQFNPNFQLLLLVFIGNEKIGYDLVDRIIQYKSIQNFNIAFCFNSKNIYQNFKTIIKLHFSYYSIYLSNDFGTDIVPTFLMYDDLSRNGSFQHIIKLHTKSIQPIYLELTNFLLKQPFQELISKRNSYCNCIGHPKYYIYMEDDIFNKLCLVENYSFINTKKCFVGGTIFYCHDNVMKATVQFIKKTNFRCYLLNNLYENNTINQDYSPIHFLERVFGIIQL